MATKEVTTTTGPVVDTSVETPAPYLPGEDWDTASATADQVAGHDLAKDELLDALVGVPFMITRVTFRQGISKPGVPFDPAVMAAECVIAPENVLKRRRVNMPDLPFEPLAQVVFNDGSTGIYRQIVAYLAARGFIDLPDSLPEAGSYGQTRYDLPPSEWTAVHAGELAVNPKNGYTEYTINVRLTCPRGLRLSEYTNDYNPAGSKTRYLA